MANEDKASMIARLRAEGQARKAVRAAESPDAVSVVSAEADHDRTP